MMTKDDSKHRLDLLLDDEKPTIDLLVNLGFDLNELKAELKFRLLYKKGLIFYLSPQEFSWITGISKDMIYDKIQDEYSFFKKPNGYGRYRCHVSWVGFYMSGKSLPRDARTKKSKRVPAVIAETPQL